MCYQVSCTKCGKTTWGGCGFHVASVYRQIQEGQHCMCRSWPGIKTDGAAAGTDSSASQSVSGCTIL